MRALQKLFTGSSMPWAGLRWGAAGISLAAHGAAATLAFVLIESEPAQVTQAFSVEVVSVDQIRGAASKKPTVSASVSADHAKKEKKTDQVRGIPTSIIFFI